MNRFRGGKRLIYGCYKSTWLVSRQFVQLVSLNISRVAKTPASSALLELHRQVPTGALVDQRDIFRFQLRAVQRKIH